MTDEVREAITTHFFMAWLADLKGETLACSHYLTRAFRILSWEVEL